MDSKDVRNVILTLIILAAGVWLLTTIGNSYIPDVRGINIGTTFTGSLNAIATIITIFSAFFVVVLFPVYLYKRSKEKKQRVPVAPYKERE